jgi:hypothetical protein
MSNCARIRELCRETHARRHQLALAGVMWAMEHGTVTAVTDKTEMQRVFETEVRGPEARWVRQVDRIARNPLVWRLALLRSLGPRHALA